MLKSPMWFFWHIVVPLIMAALLNQLAWCASRHIGFILMASTALGALLYGVLIRRMVYQQIQHKDSERKQSRIINNWKALSAFSTIFFVLWFTLLVDMSWAGVKTTLDYVYLFAFTFLPYTALELLSRYLLIGSCIFR